MSLHTPNNLNEHHVLGRAHNIGEQDLRFHLSLSHALHPRAARTNAELGKLHLLAHAVQAHPELKELLNLPETWGR